MNAGEKTIDWLYREQLKVDDDWSVKREQGFTWWADKNAQTIEVIGSEQNEAGDSAYLISVRTDFLRNVELTPKNLQGMNALLMSFASMAGPVYDSNTRSLSLCSLVRVHEGIRPWISLLISMASVLQVGEARIMGPQAAELFGAEPAETEHPENGWRSEPDEMANIIETLIAPVGRERCKWTASEFQQTVNQYMQRPPSLCATAGGAGLTVEFPYGNFSSLCQFQADQAHPRYGNGLLLVQSFPVGEMPEAAGANLALDLNAVELTKNPAGYGFGSFCYRDKTIHFTGFLPNVSYRSGLLPNLYFTCAARAHRMAENLAGT